MAGTNNYGIVMYKITPSIKFPLLRDFIIESIDKKVWLWLLKCINITYNAEFVCDIRQDYTTKKYTLYDVQTNTSTEITDEEAAALFNKYQKYYNRILPKLFKYNIPVYEIFKEYYDNFTTVTKTLLGFSINNNNYTLTY